MVGGSLPPTPAAISGPSPAAAGVASPSPSSSTNTSSSAPVQLPGEFYVLKLGYLQKVPTTRGMTRSQRRYVVLTRERLHWFKRNCPSELFGHPAGSVPIHQIVRVATLTTDDVSFEVVTRDRRKRVFKAAAAALGDDGEEGDGRDAWVRALRDAINHVAARGEAGDVDDSSDSRAANTSEDAVVDLVSYKTQTGEVVVSRGPAYGTTIPLANISKGDMVMVWMRSGVYATIQGDEIAEWITTTTTTAQSNHSSSGAHHHHHRRRTDSGGSSCEVSLLDGSGYLSIRFHQREVPKAWFREGDVIRDWVVAMAGAFFVNLVGLLLVVAYLSYTTYERYQRSLAAVGQVDMVVEGYYQTAAEEEGDGGKGSKSRSMPARFLSGCQGDMIEARRRWDITRKWREEFEIDKILDRPHPHYHTMVKHWPDFLLTIGKNGDPVYLDRTSRIKIPELLAAGLTVEEILHHTVFMNEFVGKHLMSDPEVNRQITIYDLKGANIADLSGKSLMVMKRAMGLVQQHYLGRDRVLIMANAPSFMPLIWRIIKPLFDPEVVRTLRVASPSTTLSLLSEYIDVDKIPECYGGQWKLGPTPDLDANRYNIPGEARVLELVKSLNARDPNCKHPPRVC